MHHRLSLVVLPVLFVVGLQGCSSTFEDRQPEKKVEAQDGDSVIVHRPKNGTIGSGRSFSDFKETDQLAEGLNVRVTAFPRAGRRVQDALASILENEDDELVLTESTEIQLPYRRSPEESSPELRVQKTDRERIPDQAETTDPVESSGDLVVTGHIEEALVGMGKAVEKSTDQRVPDGYAVFQVKTVWQITVPDKGSSERYRINDRALVNFSIHQDPIKRFYRLKTAFHQLLRRVAWRVASRLIPHQYDTAFGKEDE